jgi:hypothetical protein
MNNTKIHLIPQPVIDCVEGLRTTKQDHMRLNYIVRLEAIRDYCDAAIKSADNKSSFTNNKSKGKFSRIG